MKFQFLIAKKFMLGGSGSGPSRLNGWVSIIGMIIGTFAILISLSVMNGFEERVIKKLIGFEGDIRISPNVNTNLEDIFSQININPSIDEALLFKERIGIILANDDSKRVVTFKSIDMTLLSSFYDIAFTKKDSNISDTGIAIGYLLAQRLNVDIGDQITIMSPIDQSNLFGLPILIDVKVSKIFNSQVLDFDDRIVFISNEVGDRIFLRKKTYDGIDIRLKSRKELSRVKLELQNYYKNSSVHSWEDLHASLISAMRLERLGALTVLCLIILVSSFNLISTLVLVIMQKVRQIGILRAIGATNIDIKKIIITQGILIGGFGALIGIIASYLLIIIQNSYGIIPIPSDIYFISQLPMMLKPNDIFMVALISLLFIVFSSLLASRQAIIIGIRKSLQWEK